DLGRHGKADGEGERAAGDDAAASGELPELRARSPRQDSSRPSGWCGPGPAILSRPCGLRRGARGTGRRFVRRRPVLSGAPGRAPRTVVARGALRRRDRGVRPRDDGRMPRFLLLACALGSTALLAAQWQPADPRLLTRWAQDVAPDRVHPEHPRPHLVRPDWRSLNGLWDYAIVPRTAERPDAWTGRILVPFAIESALSGVGERVGATARLWYRRTFTHE